MPEVTEDFRNAWVLIFRYLRLAAHPCLERLMEKGRNSTKIWKAGMLLWLPPLHTLREDFGEMTRGEQQRWRQRLFLNTHSLTTHMTWPRRGNGTEMGRILAWVLSLHAVRQPVISILLLPMYQPQLQEITLFAAVYLWVETPVVKSATCSFYWKKSPSTLGWISC